MASGRWAGSDRRARLPRGWQRTVRRILRRDPVCTACCAAPSVTVDHAIANDDDSDANLRGLCAPCHRDKSTREGVQARHAIAAARYRAPEPHPGTTTKREG